MFIKTLSPPTRKMFDKIQGLPWIAKSYLAGGTALALHFGHRISNDLDFFINDDFKTSLIRNELSKLGPFRVTDEKENTLVGSWPKVKLSLMKYPYKLLEKTVLLKEVPIASVTDITLMKLDAVSARGTKRDFVDLFWVSKHSGQPLIDYVRLMRKKFGKDYSVVHLIKSLCYFLDADREPMPKMLKKLTWEEVKSYFIFQSMELARRFIM